MSGHGLGTRIHVTLNVIVCLHSRIQNLHSRLQKLPEPQNKETNKSIHLINSAGQPQQSRKMFPVGFRSSYSPVSELVKASGLPSQSCIPLNLPNGHGEGEVGRSWEPMDAKGLR